MKRSRKTNQQKTTKIFACDFETTVQENTREQNNTEVWAAAYTQLFSDNDNAYIEGSIEKFFTTFFSMEDDVKLYFHNLKFDGTFIISYLFRVLKFKCNNTCKKTDLQHGEFQTLISDMGAWYSIIIKYGETTITILDSLKLMPFKLKDIGKSFKTKHQKLEMEYIGNRHKNCSRTKEEDDYIKNDVLVLREALEIMFTDGHTKMTIGSCCMSEFLNIFGKEDYDETFPDLSKIYTAECHNSLDTDEYIRKSYHGGWCYLKEEYANRVITNGITADVNSLYPSVMSGESGNLYPVRQPHFWIGDIPKQAKMENRYYFIRFSCRFYLRENFLPTVQIKNNYLYKSTEWLKTSDVWNKKTEKYDRYYIGVDGKIKDSRVELTMTCTDYELFLKHYNVEDLKIIDGCWFYAEKGLFDKYIEKYQKIKIEGEGAIRTEAKLFLNNLYGKLASSTDSSSKIPFLKDDGTIGFKIEHSNDKKAGYIAVGSAITSYARYFTITHAQENYEHFIYADTDSIHCNCTAGELKNIKVHKNNFLCWKLEATWDKAIFVRQKTYIERVIEENLESCEPYYNIKCAGMGDRCKKLLDNSLRGVKEIEKMTEEEKEFLQKDRELTDFTYGLCIPSKLLARQVVGGIVLTPTTFQIR